MFSGTKIVMVDFIRKLWYSLQEEVCLEKCTLQILVFFKTTIFNMSYL